MRNKWIIRGLALLLACSVLLGLVSVAVFATETDGTGEEFAVPEDAVYISTAEELLALAESCVSDIWSRDKVIVLTNDIDLSGVDFAGIPTFGGTFLGQGYTISGLRLSCRQDATGFFRYLQQTALVQQLHIKGIVQAGGSGDLDIGGIVGVNSGTVRDCTFSGTVSGTEHIGGIAGRNNVSGILEDCRAYGVIYGDHYIGGIAGENRGVVRGCINRAEVNSHVDHNSVSVSSSLSLESLTGKESISDATNIGGIAGTSSGVIRDCENRAAVGYEKMGYNVGGIAGSQIGYITECENYGTVNGSNGVGGIVGQFKPNVVLNFGENPVSEMMDQMMAMMGSMNTMMGSMQGMMGDMSANMDRMEESVEVLKDPENWDPDTLQAATNEMSSSFNSMYQGMVESGSNMTGQMSAMMGTMSGVMGAMEKMNQGMNIRIIDISKEDTPEDTTSKLSFCANHGQVLGETYVGGIAGIADLEDTTAREDVEGALSLSNEGEMIMRLVIRDCRNLAKISASKAYAGGITGNMVIGAVMGCINIGGIDAVNADYVGGIAGASESCILNSFNRCALAGSRYVGGIAGFGTEVSGCYAITDIAAAEKYAGGILGSTDPLPGEGETLILGNYYHLSGKNLGGIDGISYAGATDPVSVAEFLAVEGLDQLLRTVSVRFMAEGCEDVVLTVELGQDISMDMIPQLEVSDREQYRWELCGGITAETVSMGETGQTSYISLERLTDILFDQTYLAVYDGKNTVVASEEKTEDGRSLALAVGAFDRDTGLYLRDITGQVVAINGTEIREAWEVCLEDMGVEKLHYHIPGGLTADTLRLYVQEASGSWAQREFTVEGSYMIFSFTYGETAFALEVLPEEEFPVAAAVAAAAAVIFVLMVGKTLKKSRAGRKGTEVEK